MFAEITTQEISEADTICAKAFLSHTMNRKFGQKANRTFY